MGDKSKIEWTDATWNPIRARNLKTGKIGWHCEHDSEGCRFCYAETRNRNTFFGNGLDYKPGHRADIELFLDDKTLLAPLRWRRSRMTFVGSMTDAFAKFVTDEMLDNMFAVAALCPNHTLQFLTKRSGRMRAYCADPNTKVRVWDVVCDMAIERGVDHVVLIAPGVDPELAPRGTRVLLGQWPLPNVWLGVSCEDQENADARIPDLIATPAAVRFVSAEPLLGPIDFHHHLGMSANHGDLRGLLDWIIVGGESGLKARPMSIQWAREIRDQCATAGVAFFFKQWGEWRPAGLHCSGDPGRFAFGDYEWDRARMVQVDAYPREFTKFGSRSVLERVGKKAAGRLLDGREHNDMPRPPA